MKIRTDNGKVCVCVNKCIGSMKQCETNKRIPRFVETTKILFPRKTKQQTRRILLFEFCLYIFEILSNPTTKMNLYGAPNPFMWPQNHFAMDKEAYCEKLLPHSQFVCV